MRKALLILIVILALVASLVVINRPRFHTASCTNNPQPIFEVAPTNLKNITQITPPAFQVGSGVKSHSYINVDKPTPVYAPSDSVLITGAKYTESYIDPNQVQYTLLFEVSCEVSYYYDHLINPPEKIAELFPNPPTKTTHSTNHFKPIEIKAGEVLGYSWSGQFDFGVLNNSKEPILKDFPEYKNSEKAYPDCIFSYYRGKLQEEFYQLSSYDNMNDLKVIEDLCGITNN